MMLPAAQLPSTKFGTPSKPEQARQLASDRKVTRALKSELAREGEC
jgi:hypothetical protein